MAATNAFCRLRGRFFLSEHFEDGVKLRFFFVLLKLGVHRVPVCGLVGDLGDSGLVSMAVCRDSHHLTSSRVFCPQGDCMALWIKSASILLTSRAWLTVQPAVDLVLNSLQLFRAADFFSFPLSQCFICSVDIMA